MVVTARAHNESERERERETNHKCDTVASQSKGDQMPSTPKGLDLTHIITGGEGALEPLGHLLERLPRPPLMRLQIDQLELDVEMLHVYVHESAIRPRGSELTAIGTHAGYGDAEVAVVSVSLLFLQPVRPLSRLRVNVTLML